jgi:Vitamin K-dependent gamma-carboxylase
MQLTGTQGEAAAPGGGLRERVRRFFWTETTGEAAALFRVGFGVLVTYYLLVHAGRNLERYYGESGVLPRSVFVEWVGLPTVLSFSASPTFLWGVWGVTLAASIALIAGFHARIAAALVYVGVLSIENRNPFITSAAESLMCVLAFLSILAPLSLRFSLDARRRGERTAPVFGLQLLRLQLVIVYGTSVIHKLQEPAWRSGEALGRAFQAQTVSRLPGGLGSPALEHALTWGTIALEGLFFLVFFRRLRPWVLLGGCLLHLSIEAMFMVPLFSATMLTTYLTFLTDEEARRIVAWAMRPFSRARAAA